MEGERGEEAHVGPFALYCLSNGSGAFVWRVYGPKDGRTLRLAEDTVPDPATGRAAAEAAVVPLWQAWLDSQDPRRGVPVLTGPVTARTLAEAVAGLRCIANDIEGTAASPWPGGFVPVGKAALLKQAAWLQGVAAHLAGLLPASPVSLLKTSRTGTARKPAAPRPQR